MLILISEAVNFVKQIGYLGLVLSYKTGQLIIYSVNIIIQLVMYLNEGVGEGLKVLFEDFLIFVSDVLQKLVFVYEGFSNCILTLFGSLKCALITISSAISGTYNAVVNVIEKTLLAFTNFVLLVKVFVTLVGSGVWFAVTLIPGLILYACTMSTYYIGSLLEELCSFVVYNVSRFKLMAGKIYECITDTPVQSVVGLMIGCCVFYVVCVHRRAVYDKIRVLARVMQQHTIQRLFLRLTFRPVVFVEHLDQPANSDSSSTEESDGTDVSVEESDCRTDLERLCLICQERTKCIVMLPCKHVCLCKVCNVRLRNYNRTCPLCRTLVRKTMKVYV